MKARLDSLDPDSLKKARLACYRTSFVAQGAVLNTLQTGGTTPATGSLGMYHYAPREQFRAIFTLASTIDTLSASNPKTFAAAVLTPLAGRGSLATGYFDYYKYRQIDSRCRSPGAAPPDTASEKKKKQWDDKKAGYDACVSFYSNVPLHQQKGFRIYASFAKSTWRLTDSTTSTTLFVSDVTLLSGGIRYVWVPINHLPDDKGNQFSFAAEIGLTGRGLAGDISDNPAFKQAAVNSSHGFFWGPEAVLSIRVNMVTASADLPWIGFAGGPKLHGLTGLQPIVSFSADAPLFTF